MALIIIAPTATTARSSTTPGTPAAAGSAETAAVRLWPGLVDIQRASTKFFAI
jgi:hypothetical protein